MDLLREVVLLRDQAREAALCRVLRRVLAPHQELGPFLDSARHLILADESPAAYPNRRFAK